MDRFFHPAADAEALGRNWVVESRNRYRPGADPIDAFTRRRLAPYFDRTTLDAIRILSVRRIADPPFPRNPANPGAGPLLDLRFAAGITFIDTIVVAENVIGATDRTALIFHEAVHAAQYRALGLERFIRQYLRGLAAHRFYYNRIPIEAQAYRLQQHFEAGTPSFSVENDILRRFFDA